MHFFQIDEKVSNLCLKIKSGFQNGREFHDLRVRISTDDRPLTCARGGGDFEPGGGGGGTADPLKLREGVCRAEMESLSVMSRKKHVPHARSEGMRFVCKMQWLMSP